MSNAGSDDSFIVKYNSAGTPQWARRIRGTGSEGINGIYADSSGDIVVTGYFTSNPLTIYNGDESQTITSLNNEGGNDAFVVKYNSSGEPQWARQIGGSGSEFPLSITIDSSGSIIVAVPYSSNPVSIFGSSASFTTLSNAGSGDSLIVKYNSAGTPQWARRIGGTGSEDINGICTDSNGNIVVTGYFTSNPLTIYNTNGTTAFTTLSKIGSGFDAFIVKYNSIGEPQWAKGLGGANGNVTGRSITADSTGNIIVGGYYNANPLTITNQ